MPLSHDRPRQTSTTFVPFMEDLSTFTPRHQPAGNLVGNIHSSSPMGKNNMGQLVGLSYVGLLKMGQNESMRQNANIGPSFAGPSLSEAEFPPLGKNGCSASPGHLQMGTSSSLITHIGIFSVPSPSIAFPRAQNISSYRAKENVWNTHKDWQGTYSTNFV